MDVIIILKITMIKLDIFKSVFFLIFCERIIPAAKSAQGAAEPEIKFKALSILLEAIKILEKHRLIRPVRTANKGNV